MSKISVGYWFMFIGALFLISFGILALAFVIKNDTSWFKFYGIVFGDLISIGIVYIGYRYENKRKVKKDE